MSTTLANCRDLGLKHRWVIGYRRSQDGSYLMRCSHCRCEAIWRPWSALDGGQEDDGLTLEEYQWQIDNAIDGGQE